MDAQAASMGACGAQVSAAAVNSASACSRSPARHSSSAQACWH
jgi:hypothetical protein